MQLFYYRNPNAVTRIVIIEEVFSVLILRRLKPNPTPFRSCRGLNGWHGSEMRIKFDPKKL